MGMGLCPKYFCLIFLSDRLDEPRRRTEQNGKKMSGKNIQPQEFKAIHELRPGMLGRSVHVNGSQNSDNSAWFVVELSQF